MSSSKSAAAEDVDIAAVLQPESSANIDIDKGDIDPARQRANEHDQPAGRGLMADLVALVEWYPLLCRSLR